MPGDYYVSAVERPQGFTGGPFGGKPGKDPGGRGAGAPATNVQDPMNYAPTYYPGVQSVNQARPIRLGVSQEFTDLNFNMQLVRTSRVSGRLVNPDGTPTTAGTVQLTPDGGPNTTKAGKDGKDTKATYGGRTQGDGAFTIANVPPDRYILRARAQGTDAPNSAAQPLTLTGDDVDGVTVILQPGGTLTGTVTFLRGRTPVPDATQIGIMAPAVDGPFGPQPNAKVDEDGNFLLEGVSAGPHFIRPSESMHGWTLKSVSINDRDITDMPLEVRSGQTVSHLAIVFSDKQSEINGTIADTQGSPIPDYTVLAFPIDSSLWRPQARQIMTARPDQTGRYRMRGLPPGDYYLATVDPAEEGEWFDPTYLDEHRNDAARVTLGEGDIKTQDFKVAVR